MENTKLDNIPLSPEEILGPPRIDMIGVLLITLVAFVVGFLVGITVFLTTFLFVGEFSLQSGISPLLLAIITFIATVVGNYLYLWGLVNIFPNIYTRSRTLAMHISVFSILLYVCMSVVYFLIGHIGYSSEIIFAVFIAHIIFDIFGLLILTGILSLYRYSLLILYSGLISFLLSALLPLFAFQAFTISTNILFIFVVFSALAFSIATFIMFLSLFLYYKLYLTTGYDSIGDVFLMIERDEQELEKNAEKTLFL